MIEEQEKQQLLREFPNIKLSYENISHKKVYEFECLLTIPFGTKCFAWFYTRMDKETCYIIASLYLNKKEPDIYLESVGSRLLDLTNEEQNTFFEVYRIANLKIAKKSLKALKTRLRALNEKKIQNFLSIL